MRSIPSRLRSAKRTASSAARPPISPSPRRSSPRCASSRWWATTSAPTSRRCSAGGRIDLAGLEKVPGETFRWKGEYGFDLNSRETIYTHLNVFEQFTPKIPEAHKTSPFVFLGQYPSDAAARRAEPGAEAEAGRRRHDELLDRADARRAEAGAEAGRRAADQRLGGARAGRRGESREGGAHGSGDGAEDARHQARRARRADDAAAAAASLRRRRCRSRRCSIRPAPATPSRAAFSAIWRRATRSTMPRSRARSSTAARSRHLRSKISASIGCCG